MDSSYVTKERFNWTLSVATLSFIGLVGYVFRLQDQVVDLRLEQAKMSATLALVLPGVKEVTEKLEKVKETVDKLRR